MADSFKHLSLWRWRQFERVELDLSGRLSVLTGANACGKTTVLNILARHFGWTVGLLSAPTQTSATGWAYADAVSDSPGDAVSVGTLLYESESSATFIAPPTTAAPQYELIAKGMRRVAGVHIPSHRPAPAYQPVLHVELAPKPLKQHYDAYLVSLFGTYGASGQRSPFWALKETLIALAMLGEGNSSVSGNPEYLALFAGFQNVLRTLLPESVGFKSIAVRVPEVLLECETGTFLLESMSGGLSALVGMAWQIHVHGHDQESCTVLIDEPENHLHPSMQRDLLPRLIAAFPNYKFVVASHSPLIVTSLPDASVYALVYNERRRIVAQQLSAADLSGSPNSGLREILDVPVTVPVWVEERIDAILQQFANEGASVDVVGRIRAQLDAQGLGRALGDFLVQRGERRPATSEDR